MSANKQSVPAAMRLEKIRELLKDEPSVSISQLAKLFNVSEMTIHRDLAKLEQASHIRKTHGGAVAAERMMFEFDFASRRAANHKAKQMIAKKALEFINPGNRIMLDTGTTTLELAYLLKGHKDLTVITPSLAVASVLQFSKGIQTVLLGGVICEGSPDLTGAITEATLDMFAADIMFQGADGIGIDGVMYNADMRIARVDQKMRKRCQHCYILADSSKFGKTALAGSGFINEIDALITDDRISKEHLAAYKKIGAKIIMCKF